MESKESLIEEDANIYKFRRRNKTIIILFLALIIASALIIAALILHYTPRSPRAIPPINSFCSLSDNESCLRTLTPILKNKFISDPNQIFTISLQTAAYDLQRIILSKSNLSDPDSPEFNCSNSLRHALSQIRDPVVRMRVNPFVESLSEEERGEMLRLIRAAREDVASCLEVRTTAELVEAKVCLDTAANFVAGGYARVLRVYAVEVYGFERRMVYECVFGGGMCGLQLLFMFGMFAALYRIRWVRRR